MSEPAADSSLDGTVEIPEITPELSARLERLSPEKRQLVLERLRARSVPGNSSETATSGLVPVDRNRHLPLSFAQERLWVLHEMDREDAAYNIPAALTLTGDLRIAILQQALREIVGRHEALRTTFGVHEGVPVQKIGVAPVLDLPVEDLTHLPEFRRLDQARRKAGEELEEPFDLRTGPLIRGRLLRLDPDRHVLLLTVHHIVADGWSMTIIVRELEELYRALVCGTPLPLPQLSLQYADYAAWQRNILQDGSLEDAVRHWEKQLEGAPGVLDLPADHSRPPVRTSNGGTVRFEISSALAEDLRVLAQKAGVSRYMVLLASFSAFLYRISGQDDMVIGSPVAGRTRAELEPLVGFFVNTLPIRCRLSGNPTFQELLGRVRSAVAQAYSHQELPFEKLVEKLQPDRNPSRTPIFQVVFGYQEDPPRAIDLPGLDVTPLELEGVTSKFDLTLLIENRRDILAGFLEYSSDLYLPGIAHRYAECFQQVLASVAESPDSRLDVISLLSEEDETEISRQWSGASTPYPRDRSIHGLFEDEAEKHPDARALIADQGSLTYGELNQRANRLARNLLARGVTPGTSVGICMRRSVDLVAGILAILKSGGAYVPLDPDCPSERLRFMLDDAGAGVVMTDADTRSRFEDPASDRKVQIVCPATGELDGGDAANPEIPVPADQLAYIMYTSGSTGSPKGAEIPHRAVIRLVRATDYMEFSENEVFLQFAPVSFDASTLEIWGPLLNGGTLVIPPPQALSLDQLGEQIKEHKVTTLWLTSGLFNLMVDDRIDDLRGVRQLLAGGDVLSVSHVQKALEALPGTRLINGYGPTENTTFTCCFTIPREDWTGRPIPIGQPIANSRVCIVDRNLRLVPAGVPGELLAGGDGLFRGYRNRPDLNGQKLIPDPFSDNSDDRLYRTGDRARYLEDGTIEFLGRLDDQVKIRGFRIEPGEIESVLVQHPDVRECVVVARQNASGHRELAAYLVRETANGHLWATEGDMIEATRAFIDQKLPSHLAPSSLTVLAALPLNPNGKVDRGRLPEPTAPTDPSPSAAPASATEQKLVQLWREVLVLDVGSIDDNFFEIGGNSLLATQIISRIRKQFSLDIPIHDLFRYSTIRGLGARIDHLRGQATESASADLASIRRMEKPAQTADLSFAQERLWFLDRLEPDNPFYNIAFAHRVRGPLDVNALELSLTAVVHRHEVLRGSFVEVNEQAAVRQHECKAIPIPVQDLRDVVDMEGEVVRRAYEEARAIFDLKATPLLRARVLVTGPNESVLLVTMHHIVADGWSLGVLVRELAAHYRYHTTGEPSELPELPIQYADFSRWQREWLTGAQANSQLSYWRRQLSSFPAELKLPTDRSRPPAQSFRGSSVRFEVDADTTLRLNRVCSRTNATMFMVLLSAFKVLLLRYTEQEDIIIGSPVANRNRDELEPLIGFFVNTLALRTDLSRNPSFTELVERVRRICLDAFANQDYPFEKIVDDLQPERDLSRNPLFQVMFALQNAPEERLAIPGLSFTTLELKRTAAQFDIVLDMWERDEGLLGVFEFSTDLFDESTVKRMAGHLTTLLREIAEDDSQRLSELSLLDSAEERQLLAEFPGSRRSYPVDRTLHALFEETAEKYPERTAAVHGEDSSIQYADLNTRANQIAWSLRACDLQPNQCVAILEPRSIDFLASMLGVLKAGGAFMPIDAQYPEDRIRYMLEDSQVTHLITRSGLVQTHAFALRDERIAHVLLLDDDAIGERPSRNPGHVNASSDLAYMLYTSGSTGLPKGAMVRHDGAVNHIFGEFDLLEFHLDTAFLQSAPASSDISVWQFLGPVLIGARTVVADFETVCDPAALFGLIKRERISLIELVPVVLHGILEHARGLDAAERSLPDLEWAMVTGEAVSVPLVNVWLDTYSEIRLVNAYGPTEAADDTCQFVVEERLSADRRSVPIGKPIPNMTHYVLDPNQNLVPIGVPGEICVSGIGVGKGYWNDMERTLDRFVANPYDPAGPDGGPDGILYRTGDRGFWRPDGNLECLERLDTQVKVRGFRIELGEIESLLADHGAVRESAVIVREDEPEDRRLSAYFVADLSSAQSRQDLAALRDEQVSLWEKLHANSYQSAPHGDPTFNTIGWDSNYTGAPLPEGDMKEYVDYTTERVRSLCPGRVLEIGCGTGLVMFPLLPHCESYTGMDLSGVAIDQLKELQARSELRAQVPGLDEATLLRRSAHDLSGFAPGSFDTAILPSVVQYFPGIDYFTQVLEALLPALDQGGSVFVGDVRCLGLIEVFHASIQTFKAESNHATADLLTRTRQRVESEQEMAIDPGFFVSLKDRFDRVGHVEILPKRGQGMNEMTRFRYDVLIHLDTTPPEVPDIPWQDWERHRYGTEQISALLREECPPLFAVRNIRNARVEQDCRALALMFSLRTYPDKAALVNELGRSAGVGLDPEDLWSISLRAPYRVQLSMARSGEDGRLDALFVRAENETQPIPYSMPGPEEIKPDIRCANNPLQEKLALRIIPQLRELLRERVPAYMVPSDFVLLSRMPLTPAGKIDRSALPKPDVVQRTKSDAYRPPRTAAERRMAEIWTQVLGVEAPDIGANFFDLGGHSLKATQVVSRIHREFNVEIPLRDLFSLPTIEELAAHLKGMETATYDEIPPVAPANHYPLAHAQRRLWILSQIEETSTAYNMPVSLLLAGPVDRQALAFAFAKMAERHESLRTRFIIVDDEPRQTIDEAVDLRPEYVDLTLEQDPETRAREMAIAHASMPFDLGSGPLVRMSILKLADECHVLLFNMHHIIADDWSMGVLVREISALYNTCGRDLDPDLEGLRIQYRDYAVWQNQRLDAEADEPGRSFWLSQFPEAPPVLDLQTDLPRPPVKTYCGHCVTHTLDAETTDLLRAFNKEHAASMFMTLVASVNVLLYRYTGQEDIAIGLPTAGRYHADLEGLIGFFINTLPFRMRVEPESTFLELLSQTCNQVTACLEHQMYPMDRLVDELELRRDVSRSPLYDVTITLQNVDPYELSLPDVALSTFIEEYDMSKFDLSFNFQETESGLRLDITYNSDLFVRQRVERMTRHFEQVVKSLLRDPEQPVAALDILPPAERTQVLEWRNPRVAEPTGSESLTTWFERQAQQTPDHIAVQGAEADGQSFTYRELNERANQLAGYLRGVGLKTGGLIGIYMDRSIDVVVSILGVLKAGAAYVPLDDMYPDERVAFMIRDAQIGHLVTRAGKADGLDLVASVQVVDLDRDAASIRQYSRGNSKPGAGPDEPAYIIYTSGSTGRPKGVIVTHANVARLFRSTERWFGFNDSDTWTLFHSYAFDFSVWEIWGALLYGGRLIVVPQQLSRSPADFLELLEREKVTVLNQTPSAFHQLIAADAEADPERVLALRYVIFGGEALDHERLRPWFERHADTSPLLVNMYGITETTVHATYRPIRLGDLDRKGSLVGEPLPDLRLYIVDRFENPSPLGVPGEIWVGGDGVASGYLRRPQLTAEKFTADPFRAEGQGRVYRSGDLARFLPDGDIEYLGRIDSQVQIRGFRVELGEIETRLAAHGAISEAVVLADQRGADTRLVAYCVAAEKEQTVAADLRRFLGGDLPGYMIPSHFVFLEAFPLTVNGKLDHRSLQTPEDHQELTDCHIAPSNETEEAIAAALARVLGVDQVSRDVNFFDLGAHSMSIVRVHRYLKQDHGMDISIVSFYTFPTVALLAAHIAGGPSGDTAAGRHEATDRAELRRTARRRRRGEA